MNGMALLTIAGIWVLNFGISFWNAYASGAFLTESKAVGGWSRVLTWCGLVMSACGFTWCYLLLLSALGTQVPDFLGIHGKVAEGVARPMLVNAGVFRGVMALGYAVIIVPILGSGLAIWAESVITAYRRRTFGSVARAGWNTFAQGHNMWSAARSAPSVGKEIGSLFKGGDSKGKAGLLVVALVVLAVCSGIITTWSIARWADRKVAMDV